MDDMDDVGLIGIIPNEIVILPPKQASVFFCSPGHFPPHNDFTTIHMKVFSFEDMLMNSQICEIFVREYEKLYQNVV